MSGISIGSRRAGRAASLCRERVWSDDVLLRRRFNRTRRRRRQIDVECVRQFAVADRRPQLVQQMLRQADIDAGDEHVGAQGFKLADTSAELFLILLVRHKFAGRPDAGACPVLTAEKAHSHTILLPLSAAHIAAHGRTLTSARPNFNEIRPVCQRRHDP